MAPRVLVVGAGSIGTRHIKNLLATRADVAVAAPDEVRATATGARVVPFDRWAAERPDAILLASPTVFHADQIDAALETGAHVLVEKPMTLDAEEAEALAARGGDRLAVAFNLRLHPPVAEVIERARAGELGRIVSARFWYGQHLATWRPGTDYRTGYSAQAKLGGGILNDASHELDLLLWLLGTDVSVAGAAVQRSGLLDADVEDVVRAVVRAGDAVAEISLDALSRRYRRGIEIIGSEATARFDWARSVLEIEREDDLVVRPVEDHVATSYEVQAERLLRWVEDGTPMPVDGATGAASVRLAAAIRAAG